MSTAVATQNVNYSEHLTDSTSSPKTTSKSAYKGNTDTKRQFFDQQKYDAQQTGIMPSYGGGSEQCARCSKIVYLAEKRAGAGRAFHSRCFSCRTCNRKLDASTLSEHKGEIYCKTCYTRQFGVHGLAQGVTMTTENVREGHRPSRRASCGDDLDASVTSGHHTIHRTHSNDSTLRGEHSGINSDEVQKLFPWRNEYIPNEQHPPKSHLNINDNHTPKKDLHRISSPIGFQRVVEHPYGDNHYRHSASGGELDRYDYNKESDRDIHANRISSVVHTPFAPAPQRVNSTIQQIETPLSPMRNDGKHQQPSPISTADAYRRETSREHSIHRSDSYSLTTMNELNHEFYNPKASDHNVNTNIGGTQSPGLRHLYSHSRSHEDEHPSSGTKVFHWEQGNPNDPLPTAYINIDQRLIPSSTYSPSNTHGTFREDSGPTSILPPPYNHLSPQSSQTGTVDRRPPTQNQRPGSALNELVARSSKPLLPSSSQPYSAIGALVDYTRPILPHNHDFDC